LEQAKRGKIEQVTDEPEEPSTSLRLITYQLGRVAQAARTDSDVFD